MGFYIWEKFIPYYGLCIGIGILAALAAAYFLTKRAGLDPDYMLLLAAYAIGGGFIGAKLLYLIVAGSQISWSRLFEWEYFLQLLQAGYVFYGGLLGGLAAIYIAGKIHRLPAGKYLETCILCLPLAHGFGRIGCHLAGCCYGIRYSGPGHIVYHTSLFAPCDVPLFPVQLLEACINFMIAGFLFLRQRRNGWRAAQGNVCIYLTAYPIARFLLEAFLRDDSERGKWLMFSTSQWICLFLLCGVAVYLIGHRGSMKKADSRTL